MMKVKETAALHRTGNSRRGWSTREPVEQRGGQSARDALHVPAALPFILPLIALPFTRPT